jgi:tetratricopeptide (TPR) repeat protein
MPRFADFNVSLSRVGWLVGLCCLGAITFAHPSASRMYTIPGAFVTATLWLVAVAALIVGFAIEKAWRLPERTVTAGLAVLALCTLASALFSPFSAASLTLAWPTFGGVAICLLLHHWLASPAQGAGRQDLVARVIALGGVALVFVSLLGWAIETGFSFFGTRNAVPFGHSNYTAGCLVLLLPWLVSRIWCTEGLARGGWSLASIGAIVALLSTSSRAGALAAAIVAAAFALGVTVASRLSRGEKLLVAGGVLLAGLILVAANPRLRDLVLGRGWSEFAQASNVQRATMLDAGIRLGRERPVLGWGPGSVPLAYPRIRQQLDGGLENVLQLHNTPIQLWATLGAGGIVALGLLVSGTAGSIRRALRRKPRSVPTLAAAASAGGYAIFALTDHQLDVPAIAVLAAANLALLTATSSRRIEIPLSMGRRVGLAAGVVAIVGSSLLWLGRDLRARFFYDRGLDALGSERSADFVAALETATHFTPHDPYFQHQIVGWLLETRSRVTHPADQERLTRDAVARLKKSLATGAFEEFAHFNLGWLFLDLGEPAAAIPHFTAAARLVPDKGGVYFGLGLALQATGRREDAVRAFALEEINDPRSVTSPAWELPKLGTLRPLVREEVRRLYTELRSAFPPAALAQKWSSWWQGETIDGMELGRGFTADSSALSAALPFIASRIPVGTTAATWAKLYAGWRIAGLENSNDTFLKLLPDQPEFAAALTRRAARHPSDFRAFLAAGTEDEPVLLRTMRRQRPGYGVLARHPEGPVLGDAFVVQENRLIADFAAGLFPPKGWVPGRFLLALLPPDAR